MAKTRAPKGKTKYLNLVLGPSTIEFLLVVLEHAHKGLHPLRDANKIAMIDRLQTLFKESANANGHLTLDVCKDVKDLFDWINEYSRYHQSMMGDLVEQRLMFVLDQFTEPGTYPDKGNLYQLHDLNHVIEISLIGDVDPREVLAELKATLTRGFPNVTFGTRGFRGLEDDYFLVATAGSREPADNLHEQLNHRFGQKFWLWPL